MGKFLKCFKKRASWWSLHLVDEDEARSSVQKRDKDRRRLVLEALARVIYGMKVWTRNSRQEREESNAYERRYKITTIFGYLKFSTI